MSQTTGFLVLIGMATLAFAWVLWPFFGAVFWSVVIAIVFHPLFERLLARLNGRTNLASFATVSIVLLSVVMPLLLIAVAIIQEASAAMSRLQSGEIDMQRGFQRLFELLPDWSKSMAARLGLDDFGAIQSNVAEAVNNWIGFVAPQIISIGQGTVSLVISLGAMLYLTFFLLRDGKILVGHLKLAVPLRPALQDALLEKFTLVVRATVKGDIMVAMLQGGLGGLGFWFLGIHAAVLWMVLMSFLSLLPLVGAAVVWLPVAIYLLGTGSIWQGIALLAYGTLVIGLVDNFVRPFLIGHATKMPEYVVLISTLGGIATFGLQGFITGPVIAAMFIAVWTTFLTHDRL